MSSPNPQHPGFWGGGSVRDGRVRRLGATTFAELVSRYISIPVPFPLSRKEFWELTSKERDTKKDGSFVCACGFLGDNETQRNDANATSLTACILDLDEGEFIKELVKHPDTLADALYPHNFVAWHTAKSTPQAPRIKVMLEVSPCAPVNLKRFISRAAQLLAIPSDFKGHKESAVVSQAQYKPILFKGETTPPVIASRVNGIPMHISDLPELEPEDEELLNGRTYAAEAGECDEFFGLAYLPVAGLALEDLSEAMDALDPDMERPQWVQVAAALRHQFPEEDEAREAYEKFVEWSTRGTKFAGRKDTWSLWKSLRPFAKGRAPVTVRTLYKMAGDAGWDNSRVAKKLAKTVEEWISSCQDADTLMMQGGRMIASAPFKNDIVEASLISKWKAKLIALGGEGVTSTTLKNELARVRNEDKKAKREAKKAETPTWLSGIIYVLTGDYFYNTSNTVAMKPAAFDRYFSIEMMPEEDAPANGIPPILPSNHALNNLKILRVEDQMYDPTQKSEDRIFVDKVSGKLMINTYDYNSTPIADPEFADRAEALIRKHVSYLVAEPHMQEMLLSYLALQVQFPGRKIPWSFLIQSAPGVGKGTLGEIMEAVLGPINVKIISCAQLSASFNEWSVGSVFGIFNEVHIPGERRDQIMNNLKPIISDVTISLNLKHRDGSCRQLNTTNYIAFSNYRDAAHLTANDRRWAIIFSPIQTREQSEELQKSGHFETLRWLTTPEGASALRYFFLKFKICEDFPLNGHAPNTKYREEVVEQSKNALQTFIEDLIDDNDSPLICDLAIHDGALKQLIRNPRDHAFIPRYLSLMGFERHSSKRVMLDGGQRGYIWVRTEKWTGGDPVRFLKKRLKETPELDTEDDSDCEFE